MSIINNGRHNAVRFTFANGYEVSAIWGSGSYSSSRDVGMFDIDDIINPKFVPSEDVEVAVFDEERNWATETFFPELGDQVKGYLPVDELIDLLVRVRDYKGEVNDGHSS